ncbi:MAG TPA: DNA polymerase III subunit delta [Agriterribacter sp.]|nr:DNA polymerase III subunit delta [Agriterribacter sp.]
MSVEKIIEDWKSRRFKPVYWLEGEESFFIDQLVDYAEHHILSESEAGFNLSVFYGKDANWADLINACRRYPMFSENQVVILKEAQQMKDVDKLEGYIANPLSSTILVIAHKEKKLDGRSKLSKLLKQKALVLSTKKWREDELYRWAQERAKEKGFSMALDVATLLVQHIGNDMSRINNEIEKLLLNLQGRKAITADDVEKYVGISKEHNVFELQKAMSGKDLAKAIRIIQYFESNPKAAPIQLIIPTLYAFFSKVYMIFGVKTQDNSALSAATGINSFFLSDYTTAAKKYEYSGVEKALLLLHQYNLRSIGVHDAGTNEASLLKELVWKIMQ